MVGYLLIDLDLFFFCLFFLFFFKYGCDHLSWEPPFDSLNTALLGPYFLGGWPWGVPVDCHEFGRFFGETFFHPHRRTSKSKTMSLYITRWWFQILYFLFIPAWRRFPIHLTSRFQIG